MREVSATPAARLIGVGKQFGDVWACRGIDLTLCPGEVHALMGENGAGKSTLVKMLQGLHRPDEGGIEVAGAAVTLASPRDAERAGIAMVPQELDLFPDLSVAENLFVGRERPRKRWGAFDGHAMRAQAAAALAKLGANVDPAALVAMLSGAQAQLVEIARALMRDARILILDEPTAALTAREADRLLDIVRDLTRGGVAIVYISHRLGEVFDIADRVTVLRDGAPVHQGPIANLDAAGLVHKMVGRPVTQLYQRTRNIPGETLLRARGLGRKGKFSAINLDLRRGEIVGLSGLIGAGRSEVAQALFGFAPADAGTIEIDGVARCIASPADALAAGMVYVPEERRSQGLMLEQGVAWNTGFAALGRMAPHGFVARGAERALADHYAGLFAIRTVAADPPVIVLSGGNQQKVLLAKALATQPDIVLLDEPTRGVDVGAKAEIYRIVDQLAADGKAVLLISSELNELLSMCDRILVMHQGRLTGAFDGPHFDPQAIGAAAAGLLAEALEDLALHPGGAA
ncbi:sugar ABC transporter ATP-binding protein [Sphingomonas bacterium]|uniref:sugar ABC transporter ATP-binding protein n=1 Tax=Sphingomonas bacterium TaxID=1895847 RepID=UPI0015752B86|nr:sugar ABC transporter ATP-binding protein [Sphingomonas bacterium]